MTHTPAEVVESVEPRRSPRHWRRMVLVLTITLLLFGVPWWTLLAPSASWPTAVFVVGTLLFAATTGGADRSLLVTDAMSAAGMPDGSYDLGDQAVIVADWVARHARDGSIAGSTLTMDAALRQAVGAGIPIEQAARMAATTPAERLGLGGVTGAIVPGLRADLVLLSPELHVTGVLRDGA